MATDDPQVVLHDVMACFFCDKPVDDERFGCELRVRQAWQPTVELQYVCHVDCLRRAGHPAHPVRG